MVSNNISEIAMAEASKADGDLDAKHNHLITELESSEGHTASTLR